MPAISNIGIVPPFSTSPPHSAPGQSLADIDLREKLVKIGARIVSQGRYVVFQLAEGSGASRPVRRDPPPDPTRAAEAAAVLGHEDRER